MLLYSRDVPTADRNFSRGLESEVTTDRGRPWLSDYSQARHCVLAYRPSNFAFRERLFANEVVTSGD
jgi:hypothetical protein